MRIAQITVKEFQHGYIQTIASGIGCQISDSRRRKASFKIERPPFVEIESDPDVDGIEDADGPHRTNAEFRKQGIE